MPTSSPLNLHSVLMLLNNLAPRRVLDIGCGFGKYGVLAREYLDVWHERITRQQWQTRIVGIEAFPDYRNPIHEYVYNQVHFGDASAILPGLDGQFDVVLILDVIEHLEKPAAQQLVRESLKRSPVVIVSTPAEFYAQTALCGNPFEMHRCHWTAADFERGVSLRTFDLVACKIFVASREPLPDKSFALVDPADVVYLRSRNRLKMIGLPASLLLKVVNRLFS
jgi:2-polyprenyl-3-methyl-5-hydroxy-6-metoxy-1,4-benzoquinol methylase